MQSYLPTPQQQLTFHTNSPHKGKELRFLPLKCTAILPCKIVPHMGKELQFLFTCKCIALTLPTNPSSHGEELKLSSP